MTTTQNFSGINPESNKVINYMSWKRTKKQIVWEFFWLREEAIYDDNWENVTDFINEFKDVEVLKRKWVKYIKRLSELWVSEKEFNELFSNWLPVLKKAEVKVEDDREDLLKRYETLFWKKAWNIWTEKLREKVENEEKKAK